MRRKVAMIGVGFAGAVAIAFFWTSSQPEAELVIPEILKLNAQPENANVSSEMTRVQQLAVGAYKQAEAIYGDSTGPEVMEFLAQYDRLVGLFAEGRLAVPEDATIIKEHIRLNTKAIETTDALLQYEAFHGLGESHHVGDITTVLRARLCRAGLEAAAGNSAVAVDDLVAVLKLCRGLSASSTVPFVSRGLVVSSECLRVAIRLFAEKKLSADQAQGILKAAIETAPTPEALANAIRVGFKKQLRLLEAMKPDAYETCEAILEMWDAKSKFKPQLEERRDAIWALIEGHPNPWDQIETRQLLIEQAATSVKSFLDDSSSRPTDVSVPQWPNKLSLFPDLLAMLSGPTPLPADFDLDAHKKAIRPIANCLGKHLVSETNATPNLDTLLRNSLADRRCWTVVLAGLIHQQKTGDLPSTLDDLVKAQLISSVPGDPFGSELLFDAKRGVVWSIGANEKDENGIREDWGPEDDRVRRIAIPTDTIYHGK